MYEERLASFGFQLLEFSFPKIHKHKNNNYLSSILISLSRAIKANVQGKIIQEEKKNKRRKKDEEETNFFENNNDKNSSFNKKSGRVNKKDYLHPIRSNKIKIGFQTHYTQQEKVELWFGICRFVYNKCVSWCQEAGVQFSKKELRQKFYDHDLSLVLLDRILVEMI
eukprot:Pgem_evm3s340